MGVGCRAPGGGQVSVSGARRLITRSDQSGHVLLEALLPYLLGLMAGRGEMTTACIPNTGGCLALGVGF